MSRRLPQYEVSVLVAVTAVPVPPGGAGMVRGLSLDPLHALLPDQRVREGWYYVTGETGEVGLAFPPHNTEY